MEIIIVVSAYIAAQILSDISSLKIILLFGLSMDAGTLIYPITFTLRDMVHKIVGRKNVRILIICAAIINIFMALYFWIISKLPNDPEAGITNWDNVLSPVWRIVVASIIAEVVSELIDTEAYHIWVTRITTRFQWMRVLFSNAISVPIDSLIFCWFAFGGIMPNSVVWSIVLANIILKGLFTLVGMPMIYLVKGK
jgi:hypothetical protein